MEPREKAEASDAARDPTPGKSIGTQAISRSNVRLTTHFDSDVAVGGGGEGADGPGGAGGLGICCTLAFKTEAHLTLEVLRPINGRFVDRNADK